MSKVKRMKQPYSGASPEEVLYDFEGRHSFSKHFGFFSSQLPIVESLKPEEFMPESKCLDHVNIFSEFCEVNIFLPLDVRKLVRFESDRNDFSAGQIPCKLIVKGEIEVDVLPESKTKEFVYVPIVWVLRSEEAQEMFPVLTPVYVERSDWAMPVYHYAHPAHLDYLQPLLLKNVEEKFHDWLKGLAIPSSRGSRSADESVLFDYSNTPDGEHHPRGIFHPEYGLQEAIGSEELFYLYNFTNEPVRFFSFSLNPEDGWDRPLEVAPRSREEVRASFSEGDFLVSVGKYRVEWLWI